MEQMRIKVETAVLRARADAAEQRINAVRKSFGTIAETVMQSRRYWEGEANDAHRKEYQEYQNEIEEALSRFQENITDLRKIAGIYQETVTETERLQQDLPADVIL